MMRPGVGPLQGLSSWWSASRSAPFQLTRYFIATSLVAFIVLGAALFVLERVEQRFFATVQSEQGSFFATVQAQLLREQKDAGRGSLVAVHESSHITLARVFANALWDTHFVPLVAQAQAVPVERCRRAPGDATPSDASAAARAQACAAELRVQVTALPGFAGADRAVRALMNGSTVFKIKVYDLRGLTVYSSELKQVGEDKADNAGWRTAAAGQTASELVHRNRFSAFEGEVQDRDLIQSYLPVVAPGGGIGGVFEIYSDVTPLLQQLDVASARLVDATTRNQALVQQAAARNQAGAQLNSTRLMLVIAALLALVYFALLFLVRNAQRIIDAEARAREQAALREQEWHRDKMATMAAMAANISHEVGNPLAIISGLAQEIAQWKQPADVSPEMPNLIVEQTARIANMTRRISDFATAGRESPEALDVNQLVRSVSEFLAFDRRFRGTPIALELGADLPACQAIPDHLTEVLMGLLQAFEESCEKCCGDGGGRIVVATAATAGEVAIRIACDCAACADACRLAAADWRVESARRSVEGMGGRLDADQPALEIHLPCAAPAAV